MAGKVLVAYATKHGSTAEIAAAIGEALAASGLEVDVEPASGVASIDRYDAVVAGSAVYMFHWQREAVSFLKRFERALMARPTWLFSSGPTGAATGAPLKLDEIKPQPSLLMPPKEVAQLMERIGARGHVTFPGRGGEEMKGFFEKWMPRGDWRDFEAIAGWAKEVAAAISSRPATIAP